MTTIPSNPVKTPLQESTADPLYTFASEACSLPANRFGKEFLDEHLYIVERFALQLTRSESNPYLRKR